MHLNDAFSLAERTAKQSQNWQLLPVVGAPLAEIEKYLAWLNASGRLKGARLCSEFEWEYAARGADAREYPHGNFLAANDANFRETYGTLPATWGPDEVGSHVDSRNPFGLDDMAGNASELARSFLKDGEYVIRGGSFAYSRMGVRTDVREVVPFTSKFATAGFRTCADL